MTEKQKQAVTVINNLKGKRHLKDEEYFLLLDFIVSDASVFPCSLPWWSTDTSVDCVGDEERVAEK